MWERLVHQQQVRKTPYLNRYYHKAYIFWEGAIEDGFGCHSRSSEEPHEPLLLQIAGL